MQIMISVAAIAGSANAPALTAGDSVAAQSRAAGEIVVTGQRNEAASAKADIPMAELPQAISVVTDETMRQRNVTRLADVMTTVAGVSRSSSYGFYDAYSIRGFDAAYGSLYLDGLINEAGGGGSVYELAGLESVEVMKGPAAILYGGGSLGGLVNLVSKRPQADSFVDVSLSTGSYGLVEGTMDANAPLNAGGTLMARAVTLFRDAGSFVRFAGQNRLYLQPSVLWRPNDRTELTVIATFKRDRDNPFSPLNAYGTVLRNVNGRLPIDFSVNEGGEERPVQRETRATIGYIFSHRFSRALSIGQTVRYTDRTSYWDRWMFAGDVLDDTTDPAGDPVPGTGRTIGRLYYGPYREAFRSLLADSRAYLVLETGSVSHKLMGGIDYRRTSSRYSGDGDFNQTHFPLDLFDPDYSARLNPVSSPYQGRDHGSQFGFYIQEHAAIGDRVTLTFNGRWDRATLAGQMQTAFSPRIGGTFELLPGIALYASWAKSFSPQFGSQVVVAFQNGVPTMISSAPPERGRSEEIGVRFALPAASLTGMVSLYRLTRTNVLQPDPDFPLFSRVSGRQRSNGVEVEAHWGPVPGLSADAAYTYIQAQYMEDEVVPVGTALPNVPRHNLAAYVRYELQRGPLAGLGAIAGAQYNSARYVYDSSYAGTSYARYALLRLAPYTLVNFGLFFRFDPWLVQANVNNVFDERYFPDACCLSRITQGQPRNLRLTLSRRF